MYAYDDEKPKALDTWGRRVDALVSGKRGGAEVVPLVAGRAKP
jgi:hypothetical protein